MLLRSCNPFVVSSPRNCYYAVRVFVLKNTKKRRGASKRIQRWASGPASLTSIPLFEPWQGVSNSIIGNGISMSIGGSPVEASELFGGAWVLVDRGVLH